LIQNRTFVGDGSCTPNITEVLREIHSLDTNHSIVGESNRLSGRIDSENIKQTTMEV
jgi:hypothetical protein